MSGWVSTWSVVRHGTLRRGPISIGVVSTQVRRGPLGLGMVCSKVVIVAARYSKPGSGGITVREGKVSTPVRLGLPRLGTVRTWLRRA